MTKNDVIRLGITKLNNKGNKKRKKKIPIYIIPNTCTIKPSFGSPLKKGTKAPKKKASQENPIGQTLTCLVSGCSNFIVVI
jgi:hypothetical protein